MKLLLFSDLHRDAQAARNLVGMSRDVDIVIGAGDFATMRKGLQDVVPVLAEIDRPTVLVPGNSESYAELAAACRVWPTAEVLHGSGTEVLDTKFWGVGGAIPITPFGAWSCDFSEEEGAQLFVGCLTHIGTEGRIDQKNDIHWHGKICGKKLASLHPSGKLVAAWFAAPDRLSKEWFTFAE